jgi:hypothetical protein
VDNYNELNLKLRGHKQEIEQLNEALKNKADSERRTNEQNRNLLMKIEMKNKENQRLSMANEQLQFRLQSQSSLSLTNTQTDNLFNNLNVSSINDNNNNNESLHNLSHNLNDENSLFASTSANDRTPTFDEQLPATKARAFTIADSSMSEKYINKCSSPELNTYSISASKKSSKAATSLSTEPLAVKLRSKSFKNPVTNNVSICTTRTINNDNYLDNSKQFRPVSESFDFNISDRDFYLTRSPIMYENNANENSINENNTELILPDLTGSMISHVGNTSKIFNNNQENNNAKIKLIDNDLLIKAESSAPRITSSSSSSTSNLNMNSQADERMTKSVPCITIDNSVSSELASENSKQLFDEQQANSNSCNKLSNKSDSKLETDSKNDSLSSASSMSLNENSLLIVD